MLWGTAIYWRMLSSTKMQLSNIRLHLSTQSKTESSEQVHIYWKRHPGLFKPWRAEHPKCRKSYWHLRKSHNADIQQAVSRVVSQYQTQLNVTLNLHLWTSGCWYSNCGSKSEQSWVVVGKSGRSACQWVKSQEQGGSVGGSVQHPSRHSQCNSGYCQFTSHLDQAFSFQKQVWFGDRPNQPDLRLDVDPGEHGYHHHHQVITCLIHLHLIVSGVTHANPLNHTFDVSWISPLTSNPQDAATIVAEVSAAAVAQMSKEFWWMREPKITKFKGRYSADAELIFWSWWVDILMHIQDHELHNKSAIQLIKEQTLENAHYEVEFQLDLCCGKILY